MLGKTLKQQYRLDGVLGEGAMGVVFSGVNLAISKPVAIKMMRKETYATPDAVERFNREARVWSQLNHPAIATVFDFGITEGQPFLVMELIQGADLSDVLQREGTLNPLRAVKLVRQLAAALEEAHRLGVVHRDIKPQNIKLIRYQPGGKILLKVLDFGMAKQVGKAEQRLTAPGMLVGTPKYVAPEQIQERPIIDGRTDLYTVGVLFYEILSGQVPFLGSPSEVLLGHLHHEPKPLPDDVPKMVKDVVMRLLRKRPDDRFPDATSLEQALEECEATLRAGMLPGYQSGLYTPVSGTQAPGPATPSSGSGPLGANSSSENLRGVGGGAGAGSSRSNPILPSGKSTSGPNHASLPPGAALPGSAAEQSGPRVPVRARSSGHLTPIAASAAEQSGQQRAAQRARSSGQLTPIAPPASASVSSARNNQSEPSQPIASQISTPPAVNRNLLGGVFIVAMFSSISLFFGLRHYLPLQRAVNNLMPSFKVPQDEQVDLALRAMEADREKRRWGNILTSAAFLDQRYGNTLLPAQSQVLNNLVTVAKNEQQVQSTYDKLIAAAARSDSEQVMHLYGQIPTASTYQPMARRDYDAAVENLLRTRLGICEELRLAGRCDDYLTEVQKLLNLLPGNAQARAASQKACPPTPPAPEAAPPQKPGN